MASSAEEAGGIDVVLQELQGAFSQADADLAEAIARANGAHAEATRASFIPAGESAEWEHVSRLLQHSGFGPLELARAPDGDAFVPTPDAVRTALTQLLASHERQQAALQMALEDAAKEKQQVRSGALAQQQQADEELKRANAALEAQLEVARGRLRQQTEEAESAAKAAEQALGALRHKLATSSHQLRAREAEVSKLQERLARELSEHDSVQKQREKQVFQEVHRRAARPHSAADTRSLELIAVYESQRSSMQREIDDLRANNAQLAEDLRERENLILRKDTTRTWRAPEQGALLGRIADAQKGEKAARDELREVESKAVEQLRQARLATAEAQRETEAERARAACLALDLSARPSVKQWTDAQATIERLRAALPAPSASGARRDLSAAAEPPPGAGGGGGGPVADSAEAIRRDREVYDLGLHSLQSLPHGTMLTLLQDCCRELQLGDARLLPAALRKMCKALSALPPMEAFIRDVCAIATSRGGVAHEGLAAGGGGGRVPSTKLVLQTLKRWASELRSLHQLHDFVGVLSDTLRQRSLPGMLGDDPAAAKGQKGGDAATMPLRDIAAAVETLVQQERKALRALDSFSAADTHLQSTLQLHPEDMLGRMLTHFQKLFEVKGTEGVLPKMNELYLYVNEQSNLLRVLKSMVGLPYDATTHQMLHTMREALDQSADAQASATDPKSKSGGGAAAKPKPKPGGNTSVPGEPIEEGQPSGNLQPKTLPQYVAIAADLRRLLHAPSVLAIVPAVKDLQQKLLAYKQSGLQMQALVQELCATLAVGSAEALIAERIQALAAAPSQ